MLNRVVGVGLERPATAPTWTRSTWRWGRSTISVAVSPSAQPARYSTRCWKGEGLEAGWGWMLFERPLGTGRGGGDDAADRGGRDRRSRGVGGVVNNAYGLPEELNG